MKILHTSDWHLGATDIERSLAEDQKFFIDEICRIAEQQAVQAVIIAGDVFDRSVASAEAIRLYDYAMTRLCSELHLTVIVIAGNHDGAERLANCSNLLSSVGLHICGIADREPEPVRLPGVDIYCLPWITEEKVRSLFPEQKDSVDSLEAAYALVTQKLRESFDPDKKHILAAHAFITNSETSKSDRAAEIGFAAQVSASVFEGFDYVALGHIHKPQNVTKTIRYCGTPMPYSFGKEETQEKGVTILDTDTMEQTVIALPLLHRRTTFTGTLEQLLHPTCSEEEQNGYVRLQITDSFAGPETNAMLRAVYPRLCEVFGKTYEGENSSISLTMEEFEAIAENPTDVFRHFCAEESDLEPDEHLISLFEQAVRSVEEAAE